MLEKNSKFFPWRANNSFSLLMNGSSFYEKMLLSIDHAENFILLETYFVESGEVCSNFIRSLIVAAKRGVDVYVMFDAMGSRGVKKADITLLNNSNINFCFYHPIKYSFLLNNFYRDHRKLLLVDNDVAYVGGAGISDHFIGQNYWRDNMLEISGAVVKDWTSLFIYNWQKQNNCTLKKFKRKFIVDKLHITKGKVAYSRGFFFNQIKSNLINQIEKSTNRVWLVSAYFVPSLKLRKALILAAKRGVEILLMLPGVKTDNAMSRYIGHGHYAKLLKLNVKIVEFKQHFIHSKIVLVDDWVTMGSSNLDRWGSNWNLEANQEIQDRDFADRVRQMFKHDLNKCEVITLDKWNRRSWKQKWKVCIWKYIGKIIAKIGLNKNE